MPAFEYVALTAGGRKRKGVLEADSERLARQQLREQQLLPVELQPVASPRPGHPRRLGLVRSLPTGELCLFTRQLATLVQSSLPLDEALMAIARQTRHPRLHKTLMAVRSRVLEGHTLAEALEEHPQCFNRLYCSMVSAGERSGGLARVLSRLADYLERSQQLRSQIRLAMIYPLVLTLVAIGVIAMLMAFVVPKVVEQFSHVGQELPWLTQWLITASHATRDYGLQSFIGLLLSLFIWRLALRNERRRYRAHRFLLRIPVVAGVSIGLNTARFAHTLSILVASGIPLLEAMQVAARTLANLHIRARVEAAAEQVREGNALSAALERCELFPPMMLYMIASGEKSGELTNMLEKAAINQEREFESRATVAVKLFEPLLIIVMGTVVLGIVLAILLPILQLNNLTEF